LIAMIGPATASALTITPTTTVDEFNENPAACSLREAIEAANADSDANADGCLAGSGTDVVELRPGVVYELSAPGAEAMNATGDLDIRNDDLTIQAPSQGATIDGNGVTTGERVIEIPNFAPAIDVTLRNVTIRDGGAALGNVASETGGGIANNGVTNAHTLTLVNSTISGNRGINAGGISTEDQATTTLINSTVSGNQATVDGGGLWVDNGTLALRNTTVSDNDGNAEGDFIGDGGGVVNSSASVQLLNSIVAGNHDLGQDATNAPDCTGTIDSQGRNLIGSTANCTFNQSGGDITGVDARLGTLANYGGPTFTHALLADSPAINKGQPGQGSDACEATDQRGLPRTLGGRCDIGSYERVTCGGLAVNRIGTGVRDVLLGTGAADSFLLFGGNDLAKGGGGGDRACGGAGKDKLLGQAGKDTLLGQGGRDRLLGGAKRDRLLGGKGRDVLVGGKGRDVCKGGPGRDRLRRC
jgi:CSLREA domain-containing protein